MTVFITSWAISAAVLLVGAVGAGLMVRDKGLNGPSRLLGILIDDRGRYSLSRFQIVLWSILVISVVAAVFFGRLAGGSASSALDFKIPPELLGAMGISIGSAATSAAVKASKNASRPAAIAASSPSDQPRLTQMVLREEGEQADKIIDVAKFQNFWITLFLVGAYALLTIAAIDNVNSISGFMLPGFSATFLTLFGISHAGYIAGKLPNPTGIPDGVSLLQVQSPDQVAQNAFLDEKANKVRNPPASLLPVVPVKGD